MLLSSVNWVFIPPEGGLSSVGQTASMFDCVQDVFLNKTFKNAWLLVVLGGQEEGSLILVLRQGFPQSPGGNMHLILL